MEVRSIFPDRQGKYLCGGLQTGLWLADPLICSIYQGKSHLWQNRFLRSDLGDGSATGGIFFVREVYN